MHVPKPTLLALVDDHRLFSAAFAAALRQKSLDVVEVPLTSLPEMQARIDAVGPDGLLLDRDLGSIGNGEDLIAPSAARGIAVVVLSATLDDVTWGRCLTLGAVTCIHKSEPFDTVLATVVAIAAGRPLLAAAERERLVACWRQWRSAAAENGAPFARLTPREAHVLGLLIEGRAVRTIAAGSYVSEATVRSHVRAILQKLDVNSQLEAVALALRSDWRPPSRPR